MKTLAIVLAAVVLVAGAAVPMALAQQDASSTQSSPQQAPSAAPEKKTDVNIKGPDVNVNPPARSSDSGINAGRSDDAAGAASPRTSAESTGFFGLSPTAAIIVSVAVLLVVVLAIVAMTNSRGTTYVDRDRL